MNTSLRLLAVASWLVLSLSAAPHAQAAYADPPGRVARISDSRGDISYSPAGEDQWVSVGRNRPLIRGDRLWSNHSARAELQVGSAAIRIGADTSLEILELSDRLAQVQMTQGTINLRVRRLYQGQTIEVATPTLAFVIDRAGRYRIDVDPNADQTTIVVWQGSGMAYGEGSNFPVRGGDAVRFYAADLRDYEMYALPATDGFDRYCLARDQRLDHSASLRYVDDDLVGYADLDEYGSWSASGSYGNVWYPTRVAANWAPYRDGHWVWQEPWGWTWVDNAPWGFAPSHYGRWASISGRWGWIPGPRQSRPVYAPALVAFVGGSNFGVSVSLGGGSRVGWFPLGPRDVYMPSYRASREYFSQVNVNNTVINNTTITNVYNNYSSGNINVAQANYANRGVASAVTVVPGDVFRNAQPVNAALVSLDRNDISSAEVMLSAPIAPSAQSVVGLATSTRSKPSEETLNRDVFARNAPPAEIKPFAAREQQLQRDPGRALEPASREGNAAANVRVLAAQANGPDARAAGSRHEGAKPTGISEKPSQLQPLDRSVDSQRPAEPIGRNRDEGRGVPDAPVKAPKEPGRDPQPQLQAPTPTSQKPPQLERKEDQAAEQQRQNDQRQQLQQQRDNAEQAQRKDDQAAEQQRQNAQRQQLQQQRDNAEQAQRKDDQAAEQQRQNAQRQQLQQQRDNAEQAQRKDDQAAEQQRQNEQRQQLQQQRDNAEQAQQLQRKDDQAAEQQRQNEQRQQLEQQQQQRPQQPDERQQQMQKPRDERQPQTEPPLQADPNQPPMATPPQQGQPTAEPQRKKERGKDDPADKDNGDGDPPNGKKKDPH